MAKPRPKAQPEQTEKTEKPETLASKARATAKAAAAIDPALDAFTKALDAFHKKDWAKAVNLLESVLAESDRPDLSARARQYLAAALDLCRKDGRDQKDERFAYLAASIHAVEGRIEEAVQALTRAIELNPRNRVHAYHDPDFAEIRRDRDHRQLFGLS